MVAFLLTSTWTQPAHAQIPYTYNATISVNIVNRTHVNAISDSGTRSSRNFSSFYEDHWLSDGLVFCFYAVW